MVIETNDFIVEYDNDMEYVPELVMHLESRMKQIMKFFGLDSLKSKKKIIMYNDLEQYKKHIEESFEYQDYMCADTNDGNINVLSLEEAHKTKEHKNMTFEDLKSVILHEFVHICQQDTEIDHLEEDIIWFWEGLATNLGNPEKYNTIPIKYSNYDINNFNCEDKNYPISYTIVYFMLHNYLHEKILEYVKYPKMLQIDSEQILNEVREWINQKTI